MRKQIKNFFGLSKKVLLLESCVDSCKKYKNYLESHDFYVDTILSEELAEQKLKKKKYDILILNFSLPNMDGIDFLKKIEKNYAIPNVMIFKEEEPDVELVRSHCDVLLSDHDALFYLNDQIEKLLDPNKELIDESV